MKTIQFTKLVASFEYGNCDANEILKCNDGFADHCVKTLKSAVYLSNNDKPKQTTKRNRRRRK